MRGSEEEETSVREVLDATSTGDGVTSRERFTSADDGAAAAGGRGIFGASVKGITAGNSIIRDINELARRG